MSKNKKIHIIKKISIALISLAMIACFILLFVAASKDRNKAICKGIEITVDNQKSQVFINEKNIKHVILENKALSPVGKQLDELNIQQIEDSVKNDPWVKDAELYVDNHNMLEINITQRKPVARVFTIDGNSYYIDEEKKYLPVNGSFAIRLPVFTGVNYNMKPTKKDSSLLNQIVAISQYISSDPFWMAQVDQININSNNEFELIPTVGKVIIEFGPGDDIENKFNKLLTFYQKGLNNIGWGYYDTLSLQYAGQVVATRKRSNKGVPVIDSLLTADGYNLPKNKLK